MVYRSNDVKNAKSILIYLLKLTYSIKVKIKTIIYVVKIKNIFFCSKIS